MTNRNEIRKAHEIVDKIDLIYEREVLRKLLPPRPEATFGETIDELRGLASADDVHLWKIISRLARFEKSYAEPAHPEFLETEADYENAPAGTVVAEDKQGPAWKPTEHWFINNNPFDNREMAGGLRPAPRRVLRWGWGSD